MLFYYFLIILLLCTFTLGCLHIYDDEYGRLHYYNDDDHHVLHDIQGFADFRTSGYGQVA